MTQNKGAFSVKKLAYSAVLICFAAALSALETALPPIVPITGVRVGLANVVTLLVLYVGGRWRAADALCIAVLRCFLASLIVGSMLSAVYGLVGGIAAWGAMFCAKKVFSKNAENPHCQAKFMPFTGVFGAVFHIAGQMATAVVFYGTFSILAYAPILLASAILGGLFTGFLSYLTLNKLPNKLLENIRNV